MHVKKIKKDHLLEFLKALQRDHNIIAPVDVDGVVLFRLVDGVHKILLDYENTVIPPKDWFFGQSQELFTFENTLKDLKIEEGKPLEGHYILFGIRPCDLKSLSLLDQVFLGEISGEPYTDNHYQRRREQTTLIGLSCTDPASSCFCSSFGLSPITSEYADLMLTPLHGDYLVEVVTTKGKKLIKEHSSLFEEGDGSERKELEESLQKKMEEVDPGAAFEKIKGLYDSDYWDDLAERCLGCGICSFLCPTCHCFDLSDEMKGTKGRRMRTWDSCMFSNFTLMTSGENPRPSQRERVRQRFFHKLRYFQERYQQSLCVGCGRCIVKCPVNIDISQIIQEVKELA